MTGGRILMNGRYRFSRFASPQFSVLSLGRLPILSVCPSALILFVGVVVMFSMLAGKASFAVRNEWLIVWIGALSNFASVRVVITRP